MPRPPFPGFGTGERIAAGAFTLIGVAGAAADIRGGQWAWVVAELIFAVVMAAIAMGTI